ncbi:MAG: hypothetical protein R3F20_15085 [Planctomycetota bacterium]
MDGRSELPPPEGEGKEVDAPASPRVVKPIAGATRLFALLLGLAFVLGSLSFLRSVWTRPERFDWAPSPWLLGAGGAIFLFVGLQFIVQAAFPERFADLANERRRRRARGGSR